LPHIVRPAGEVVISMRPVSVFANGPGSEIGLLRAELQGRWRQAGRAVMVLLGRRCAADFTACRFSPPCRHHHGCKQAEGWRLEQPEPVSWPGARPRAGPTPPPPPGTSA